MENLCAQSTMKMSGEYSKRKQDSKINTLNPRNERDKTMKVLWINNTGGGFADYLDIAENTRIEKFFNQQLPGQKAEDYLIRVNRQPVARDYVLQAGDRVTATPTKIDGAA